MHIAIDEITLHVCPGRGGNSSSLSKWLRLWRSCFDTWGKDFSCSARAVGSVFVCYFQHREYHGIRPCSGFHIWLFWNPGTKDGVAVQSKMSTPISGTTADMNYPNAHLASTAHDTQRLETAFSHARNGPRRGRKEIDLRPNLEKVADHDQAILSSLGRGGQSIAFIG